MTQASDNDTTVPLSQLLYTHEKVCNLARAPLSEPVLNRLQATAHDLVLEIGGAPAESWEEFERKLAVLVDDHLDSREFMSVIHDDIRRLVLDRPDLAEAAE